MLPWSRGFTGIVSCHDHMLHVAAGMPLSVTHAVVVALVSRLLSTERFALIGARIRPLMLVGFGRLRRYLVLVWACSNA